VNFFKMYIGDYQRDTGTLTLAQHGAYLLMLQHLYATEKPLPIGRDLHRLLRAENKAEKDAIDFVTAKFWQQTETGLVNDRAMEEIRKGAHQRTVNQEIGKRGGRPRKTESVLFSETESVSDQEPNRNPNQTPDTRVNTSPDGDGGKPAVAGVADPCPHQQIIDLYHRLLPMGRQVREWTPARASALRSRWREKPTRQTLAWWERFFTYVSQSAFLTGKTQSADRRPFEVSLDWLVKPENMAKVIEGAYHEAEQVAA
jgi:uncharacterized protein YdaU (DUF1376 family)